MKKLLFLILVIGIVVGLAPFGTGYFIEKQARDAFHAHPQNNVAHELKRGYESSELITKISFTDDMQVSQSFPFAGIQINQTIQHGPRTVGFEKGRIIVAKSKSTIQLIPLDKKDPRAAEHKEMIKQIESLYPKLEVVFLETSWFVNGSGETQYLIPRFTGNLEGVEIAFSGMEGVARHDAGFKIIKSQWEMKNLEISQQNPKVDFVLSKVSGEHDIFYTQLQQWLGQTNFMINNLAITDNNNTMVEMKDLALKSNATQIPQTENLDITFTGLLESFKSAGVTLVDSKFTWALNRLHGPSLKKLETMSQKANNQAAIDSEMDGIASAVLQQRPKFSIQDLVLRFPEGDLKLDGFVEVGNRELQSIDDIQAIVQTIIGEIHFSSPKSLVESMLRSQARQQVRAQRYIYETLSQQQTDMTIPEEVKEENEEQTVQTMVDNQLKEMLDQSILVEEQNNYTSHIFIKDGSLDMNGVVSPLIQ